MKVRLVGGNRVRVTADENDMMGVQVELQNDDGEVMRLLIHARSLGDYVRVKVDEYEGGDREAVFSWLPLAQGGRR